MINTIPDFDTWANENWGGLPRNNQLQPAYDLPVMHDDVDWANSTPDLKCYLAEQVLRVFTPSCGAYFTNGDESWLIRSFGRDIGINAPAFDGRRVPVMKAALLLLANARPFFSLDRNGGSDDIDSILGVGGLAMASLYLLSQLEYLFRVRSTYLHPDGRIKIEIPEQFAKTHKIQRRGRINRIEIAFLLYLDAKPDPLASTFAILDNDLGIAKRLARQRNPAMHGTLGDLSSEGIFYAMLLSMLYYGS